MRDIVDFALTQLEQNEVLSGPLYNRDLKHLMVAHYGDSIKFSTNIRVNESEMFFSSEISASELAIKLKNQNILREAGIQLREALLNVDFGLQDSFCDSTDLKESWENSKMPSPLLTFFSALFNTPKHKLFYTNEAEIDELVQTL